MPGGDSAAQPAASVANREAPLSVGWHALCAALVIIAAGWLQVTGLPRIGVTADEPAHLVSGLAFWTEADTRLSWGHPPLGNAIAALPALPTADCGDLSGMPEWADARTWDLSFAYVERDWRRFRLQLHRGRLGVIALTMLLGVYLYLWVREYRGSWTALLTVVVSLFNPTVLAHGRLMTNDLAVTLFIVIACGEFVRYLSRPGWPRLVTMGLAVGAAFATKWSAIALVPVFAVFGACYAARGAGRFASAGARGSRWLRLGGEVALVSVMVLTVIAASYRFQGMFWSVDRILAAPESPQFEARRYEGRMLEETSPLPRLPGWLPIPLPYSYLYGAAQINAHNKEGHRSWFMGEVRQYGTWTYFPVLIAAKSPPALLALLLVAALASLGYRSRTDLAMAVPIALGATFLVLAMNAAINIGVRHSLPVLAMLGITAGLAAGHWWRRAGGRGSPGTAVRALLLALICSCVVSTVSGQPHWLGYFNSLVGGPAGGHRISIVGEDWGQDVLDLAEVVQREGLQPLAYSPYYRTQTMELAHAGVRFATFGCRTDADALRGHWVAVHASLLLRFPECYPWSETVEPARHVNHHILVYDLREHPVN